MKVLVTGGSGFIGRNLAKRLVQDGHEVTITSTGTEVDVPGVRKVLYHNLTGIDWDVVHDQEAIFHLMANNDTLCMDRTEMFRANVQSGAHLLTAAAFGRCNKFIYASSTAVYGNSPAPYIENVTPLTPLNVYAESKLAFEQFAQPIVTSKLTIIGLRYCNVYGPGEENKGRRMSMIGILARKILRGETPKLFEFGEQKRDWVYVDDVVAANLLAMNCSESGIYNIGSGTAVSFNDLVRMINEHCKTRNYYPLMPVYIPCPFPDQYQNHTECNIELAGRVLGYKPVYTIERGIREYVDQLRLYRSSEPKAPTSGTPEATCQANERSE